MLRTRLTGISALCFAVLVAIAQKDGRPTATTGVAPPLAKDGVPRTVSVSAGSFVMGADAIALPESVPKGIRVMSTRPEHGDFDEVPAHIVHISHAFKMSVTEVTPAEFRFFDPAYQ